MKRFSLIIGVLCSFFTTRAQIATNGVKAEIEIKEGSRLIYDVYYDSLSYQFIVTVKKIGDAITFDWQMTAPINKKGTVEMSEDAVENANGLFNYFMGDTAKLTTQTSVWVSRNVWKEMHNEDDMALISLDGMEAMGFFREEGENYMVKFNNAPTAMKTSILKSLVDNKAITVWENEKCPIIVEMDLGWTIRLKEIK